MFLGVFSSFLGVFSSFLGVSSSFLGAFSSFLGVSSYRVECLCLVGCAWVLLLYAYRVKVWGFGLPGGDGCFSVCLVVVIIPIGLRFVGRLGVQPGCAAWCWLLCFYRVRKIKESGLKPRFFFYFSF